MSFTYIRAYLSVVDDNRCPISIYSRLLIALFILGIGLTASVLMKEFPLDQTVPALINVDGSAPVNGRLESFPRDFTLNSSDSFGLNRIPAQWDDSNSELQRHFVGMQSQDQSEFSMGKKYPESSTMSDGDEKPSLPANSGGITKEDFLKLGYRRHKTINGDCLKKLAEEYLHDASRWKEIYNLNIDQLTNEDVVPIGIVLIIPAK